MYHVHVLNYELAHNLLVSHICAVFNNSWHCSQTSTYGGKKNHQNIVLDIPGAIRLCSEREDLVTLCINISNYPFQWKHTLTHVYTIK